MFLYSSVDTIVITRARNYMKEIFAKYEITISIYENIMNLLFYKLYIADTCINEKA